MENQYLSGFGNHFSSEARPGALPVDQNSPQKVSLGLYAEQLSGSAFTAPRHSNLYSWLYRIRPSVMHKAFKPMKDLTAKTFSKPQHMNPNQMRWNPITSGSGQDFVDGLRTVCGAGGVEHHNGIHVHLYAFDKGMEKRYFMNADAEFMFVPQAGAIQLKTEVGVIEAEPGEIAVVPRGMKFQLNPLGSGKCMGYVGENFGHPFVLPELGPIGANGLAHRRHFLTPKAAFEDLEGQFELIGKFAGELWSAEMTHSPLDVVAWHGNYVSYKYDLRKFNVINTVSFDHPDPSIFTVLTSPSEIPGTANVDFAIFPPRWMVAEHTFRPPYFHRNCMSEYMGLIYGEYDAKTAGGFVPGGGSLHNFYSAHGPDVDAFEKASNAELKPIKLSQTMAFMFESRSPYRVSDFAMGKEIMQADYQDCWQAFKKHFK
ncbi:homogentisate 1,2-dioxygenase [Bdellovibrio sp. SKB1291214]|uniref:homogentisate 1,2-dioxygenase n=1 Tax=Bdellovibrio sp. SKB1291214 TaxID=1732569 RepID=UPI000B517C59|nr:homogentisate 1,2-dioxygenase [Bdellovibrio sp. SKB1291214]UYL10309.1 homogentisate 1,2-dioxygenase [Bdellovibrio sp. SKB1291214]